MLKAYNPCIVLLQFTDEVALLDQHHDRNKHFVGNA